MNELFVNIKVDREERPDLDRIYQTAHHLMMRRGGGWPLTMFLTPDEHVPFFGGTYFPNEPRYGMPSFTEVLTRVAEYYHRKPAGAEAPGPGAARGAGRHRCARRRPERARAERARRSRSSARSSREQFDAEFGGFGGAPKFPHPAQHRAAAAPLVAHGRRARSPTCTRCTCARSR